MSYVIQETTLKDIANAIRGKNGTADLISAAQMAQAITNLPSGEANIQPLTITSNGTYKAPEGVDGYSPVVVNVEGGGGSSLITVDPKDINFYDCFGNIVASWTFAEMKAAQALPEYPNTHPEEGIIFDGWNWTLEEIKALKAPIDVGANYDTIDKKTWIELEFPDDGQEHAFYLAAQTTRPGRPYTTDWGDGTSTASSSSNYQSSGHTYAAGVKKAIIKITNDPTYSNNGYSMNGIRTNYSLASGKANDAVYDGTDYENIRALSYVKSIKYGTEGCVGSQVAYNSSDICRLFSEMDLRCITFPNKLKIIKEDDGSEGDKITISYQSTASFRAPAINFPRDIAYTNIISGGCNPGYLVNVGVITSPGNMTQHFARTGTTTALTTQRMYPGGYKQYNLYFRYNYDNAINYSTSGYYSQTRAKRMIYNLKDAKSNIYLKLAPNTEEIWWLDNQKSWFSFEASFSTARSLRGIYIFDETSVLPIGGSTYLDNLFDNPNVNVYVPASLLESYKTATNWSKYASRIFELPEEYLL